MTPRTARPSRSPRVAVIGGGFGGLAAGERLKREGFEDFVIFERSSGLGGTWWDNRYPGAETDAASHLYCFSFAPFSWTRTHVRQPELHAYLEHVATRFDLWRHFRFEETVSSITWDEAAQNYVVISSRHGEERFDAVISAVGMFSAPRYPVLPGLDAFRGRVTHTATWDQTIETAGKRIAIMGTGSSAAQVAPTLADEAEHIAVFQRQPAWLLPKNDHDFSRRERTLWKIPGVWKLHRAYLYAQQDRREIGGRVFQADSKVNLAAREASLANLERLFADRPDLKKALTPTYAFGGKRAIKSSAFYESLLRDDVDLVPRAIVGVTEDGVIDAAGEQHPVDVLVLATGFEAVGYLASLDVVGRDGVKIHDLWNGEPYAFLGLTVPHFPNFFMLYGPNTNGGLIVSNIEHQAAYAVKEISRLSKGVSSVEVREDVTRWYNALLQWQIARTAFKATDNYFTTASGKVVTQWPDGAITYALATLLLRRGSTLGRRTRRPDAAPGRLARLAARVRRLR